MFIVQDASRGPARVAVLLYSLGMLFVWSGFASLAVWLGLAVFLFPDQPLIPTAILIGLWGAIIYLFVRYARHRAARVAAGDA